MSSGDIVLSLIVSMSSVLENTESFKFVFVAVGVIDHSNAKGGNRALGTLASRARYMSPFLGGSCGINASFFGFSIAAKVLDGEIESSYIREVLGERS